MKTWRLLPVFGVLVALAACDGGAPTAPDLQPSGPNPSSSSCGYLGSGICSARTLPADSVVKPAEPRG